MLYDIYKDKNTLDDLQGIGSVSPHGVYSLSYIAKHK